MSRRLRISVFTIILALWAVSGAAAPLEPAMQTLYQAAKAERELIWMVPGSIAVWEPVAKAFQTKFPDIKLLLLSGRSSGVPARIITEAGAKKLSFDVASTNTEWLGPLIERNLLVKYDPSKVTKVAPNTIFVNGLFHNYGDNCLVWVYNTKLISGKEVPRTWEDLLAPRFKGSKISLRRIGQHVSGMYLEWQKNPTKVIQYLEQLRKQEIMWASNTQEAYNRVATGECMIGVFRSNGFTKMKQDGAPIELAPISYAVSSPTGAILVEGVPHPNAARFLVSWLHSPEGRGALEEIGFSLAEPCDASPFARVLCSNSIKFAQLSKTMEEAKKYLVFQDDAAKALGIPPGSE